MMSDEDEWPPAGVEQIDLTLETGRGACVHWSHRVWQHFVTLRNVVEQSAHLCNKARLSVPTTAHDDTLLYLGALIEWHAENDCAMHASLLCRDATQAEQNAAHWLDRRTETTLQFDRCFFNSLIDARHGLLGDLVRTVEFLDAPHIMSLIGRLLETHLWQDNTSHHTVARLRRALFGDEKRSACAATCGQVTY